MSESAVLYRLLAIGLGMSCAAASAVADSQTRLLDPTRPSGWQASATSSAERSQHPVTALRLQGTFSIRGMKSAMISGRRVTVGDEVFGAEVIDINKNKVTLLIDGEAVELASIMPVVKSPTNAKGDRQ